MFSVSFAKYIKYGTFASMAVTFSKVSVFPSKAVKACACSAPRVSGVVAKGRQMLCHPVANERARLAFRGCEGIGDADVVDLVEVEFRAACSNHHVFSVFGYGRAFVGVDDAVRVGEALFLLALFVQPRSSCPSSRLKLWRVGIRPR